MLDASEITGLSLTRWNALSDRLTDSVNLSALVHFGEWVRLMVPVLGSANIWLPTNSQQNYSSLDISTI